MGALTRTRPPVIRSATQKAQPRYECRVVRSVAPNQPELASTLDKLRDNTGNVVRYKPLGKMGVTLVMLEPVLRQILDKDRRGCVARKALKDFEREINEALDHSHFADYDIPLDPFSPLATYGKHDQYVGIQLAKHDYRLVGDRAMVEEYIKDNYDVGKRFLARNLVRMRPHVTIGQILPENMDMQERAQIIDDPSTFLVQAAYAQMERTRQEYGSAAQEVAPIEFPATLTLNGLRIFCQEQNGQRL